MEAINSGEAKPSQNTAPKINPLTFDESALANLLKQRFSEPEPKEAVEALEPAASSEDEPVAEESASVTAEDGGETTVDESGEQESVPQQEEDSSTGVQKRINKLVAQRKEAAAKAEALERELADAQRKLDELQQAPPVAAVGQVDNPFGDVWDEAKLNDEYRKARDLRRWCEDNSDGCEVAGKEYSAEDIKAIRRKVEDAIDVHIPTRHQFLTTYKAVKPVAESVYPWWKDRSNQTYSEAQQVLRQMPQLAMYPDHQIAIGDFLEGRRMRMEREKVAKAPKAPVKVAPKQPSAPKTSPMRTDKSASESKAAKQNFMRTGSSTELAKLLQQTLLK
jgi:hypothetical protein